VNEINDKHRRYTNYNRQQKNTRIFREYSCLMDRDGFVKIDYGGIIIEWTREEYARLIGIKSGAETLS